MNHLRTPYERPRSITIVDTMISIAVRILETIFMVGLVGSAVVLLLTLVEDAKSLLPGEEKKESETQTRAVPRQQAHAGTP